MKPKKTKIYWKLILLAPLLVVAILISINSAQALGLSSDNYQMSVINIDELGGSSDSTSYDNANMLDYFVTGKFTGTDYIVKAGYLYFKPPNQPEMGTPEALSSSSIQWNFTDKAQDEEGFLLEDESGTVTLVREQANISYLTETGLEENGQYTRTVSAFNPFGNSVPSDPATACTLVAERTLYGSPGPTYMDLSVNVFPRHTIGSSAYYFKLILPVPESPESGWQPGINTWRNTGLEVNTQYTWSSSQRNICGEANGFVTLTACTAANTPGQPVISYTETNGTYNAVVSWSANGNPAGTEYLVTVNGSNLQLDGSMGGAEAWSTSLSRPHNNVQLDTTYVYRVYARNCDNIVTDPSLANSLIISSGEDEKEKTILEIIESIPEIIADFFRKLAELLERFRNNPLTQLINQIAIVPALVALALANLLAAAGLANIGSLLSSLWQAFTEPFLIFAGKRRRCWGVVYNGATKVPVDLALVRLLDLNTGQLVSTRVTDRKGRFAFITKPGKFRITVTKAGFKFPSKRVEGRTHDAGYDDLYFGEDIEIADEKTVITVSIPIDPVAEAAAVETNKGAVGRYLRRRLSIAIALIGPILGAICVWISPNIYTFAILILHIIIFAFFARVTFGSKSRPWGTVYDAKTGKPVGLAVVRIFSKRYGDLLETQVTDRRGRFGFLVGPETYRVTADKPDYAFPSKLEIGFSKYRGEDFTIKRDELVKFDIPLDPKPGAGQTPTSPIPPQPSQVKEPESSLQVEAKKTRDLGDLAGPDS